MAAKEELKIKVDKQLLTHERAKRELKAALCLFEALDCISLAGDSTTTCCLVHVQSLYRMKKYSAMIWYKPGK